MERVIRKYIVCFDPQSLLTVRMFNPQSNPFNFHHLNQYRVPSVLKSILAKGLFQRKDNMTEEGTLLSQSLRRQPASSKGDPLAKVERQTQKTGLVNLGRNLKIASCFSKLPLKHYIFILLH